MIHSYAHLTDTCQPVEVGRSGGGHVAEDCLHAIGASRCSGGGFLGDLGARIFYPTNDLCALGDRVAIVTNDPEFAARREDRAAAAVWLGIELPSHGSGRRELSARRTPSRIPARQAPLVGSHQWPPLRHHPAPLGVPMANLPAGGEHHVGHPAVARAADRSRGRAGLRKRGVATDVHFPVLDHQQPGLRAKNISYPTARRRQRKFFLSRALLSSRMTKRNSSATPFDLLVRANCLGRGTAMWS